MSCDAVWTVVVAGGSGRRFGSDKLAATIVDDTTVLDLSVATARRHSLGVVVVLPDGSAAPAAESETLRYTTGGATRSASARRGLAVVPATAEIVLVHDAARPLADDAVYGRVIEAVRNGAAAAVPVVPVIDTIRDVDGGVVDRDRLRAVQTPQGFAAEVLRRAHAAGGEATDDAGLVEALGHDVVLVDGDVRNLKITRPADIAMARALIDGAG